jgi:hypothetical protein
VVPAVSAEVLAAKALRTVHVLGIALGAHHVRFLFLRLRVDVLLVRFVD